MGTDTLEFRWKYKDYEIRACPAALVRWEDNEPNETIELVKWDTSSYGNKYCYTIAYFKQDEKEYDWEIDLVGDRFFTCVDEEDYVPILKVMKNAQHILNDLTVKDK